MIFLLLVAASLTLFGAFLLLTAFESKYGRVGGGLRRKLDKQVLRAAFIVNHVDWAGFVKHVLRTSAERVAHDSAHGILLAIRFIERLLTRAVRTLRERRVASPATVVGSRQRVSLRETLRGFSKSLHRGTPKKERVR